MKKTITVLILLVSIISFGQEKQYDSALKTYNNKKYAEAIPVLEKLLNNEYGNITELHRLYITSMLADSHKNTENYQKAHIKYIDYLEMLNNSSFFKKSDIIEAKKVVGEIIAELQLKISDTQNNGVASLNTGNLDTETTINKTTNTNAQDNKTVILTVTAQGKTIGEAKQNALRSAIEQAFGTFISSKTEILNDESIKDEIVSVANGNIQQFEVISEVEVPEVGYATTLKVIVSVTKLTSFVESKGIEIEFKGALFGANLRQQKMNENAELKAIINVCEVSNQILSNSLDYSIDVTEPVKSTYFAQPNSYEIELGITISPNNNFDQFVNYFYSSIKNISMPVSEMENYIKLNKEIYYLTVKNGLYPDLKYFFRNPGTAVALQNLFLKSNQYLHNFKVVTNLDSITIKTCCYNYEGVGRQNIQSYRKKHEIWHLNFIPSEFKSHGYPAGYPIFTFDYDNNAKRSSWETYFQYLFYLRNENTFFESNNYFTKTGQFYKENGDLAGYDNLSYPDYMFPGIHKNIGEIDLKKINYFSTYLAIYSEEEISKITKISVEQLK